MNETESDLLNAYTNISDNPVLYHYTSLSGFLGIIESGTIWATDSRYLNDLAESKELWTFLQHRLQAFKDGGRTFELIDIAKLESMLGHQKPLETYVTSFSEKDDSLGQWRAYSGGGSGVCLGIDTNAIQHPAIIRTDKTLCENVLSMLYRVRYLPNQNSSQLDDMLSQSFCNPLLGELPQHIKVVVQAILFATSFKNRAFEEEREWRLHISHVEDGKAVRFRAARSTIMPYVSARLWDENTPLDPKSFPIKEVRIGPSASATLTQLAVEKRFSSLGFPCPLVRLSEVPYRDW